MIKQIRRRTTIVMAGGVACALLLGCAFRLEPVEPMGRADATSPQDAVTRVADAADGTVPIAAPQASDFALGGSHTCALNRQGRLKCWGMNEMGQLGLGDSLNRGDNDAEMGASLPDVVLGPKQRFGAVTTGDVTTCAVVIDDADKADSSGHVGHRIACWGVLVSPDSRQVGKASPLEDFAYISEDLMRAPPISPSPMRLHAGAYHFCATGLPGEQSACKGANASGQIETPDKPLNFTLSGAQAMPWYMRRTQRLRTGLFTSCFFGDNTAQGAGPNTWWCQGNNEDHRLGINAATTSAQAAGPLLLPGNVVPSDVAPGAYYGCATNAQNELFCWGSHLVVGRSATKPVAAPTAIHFPNDERVAQLAPGWTHMCVITTARKIRCWGEGNQGGRLGTGRTDVTPVTPDQNGLVSSETDVGFTPDPEQGDRLRCGSRHCCIRQGSTDRLKCWGLNRSGQLGLGDTNDRGDAPGEMGANLPYVDLDM